MCVCVASYPAGHGGVGPLLELRVSGEAVPHDVGRVILVPQLGAALEQEVYDEELDAGVQAWDEVKDGDKIRENKLSNWKTITTAVILLPIQLFPLDTNIRALKIHKKQMIVNQSHLFIQI